MAISSYVQRFNAIQNNPGLNETGGEFLIISTYKMQRKPRPNGSAAITGTIQCMSGRAVHPSQKRPITYEISVCSTTSFDSIDSQSTGRQNKPVEAERILLSPTTLAGLAFSSSDPNTNPTNSSNQQPTRNQHQLVKSTDRPLLD